MKIIPFTENCGVTIDGVNLAQVTERAGAAIKKAFVEHGLVFFRDQDITPGQHLALAGIFGEIVRNRILRCLHDYPDIAVVSKEKDQKTNIGGGEHSILQTAYSDS